MGSPAKTKPNDGKRGMKTCCFNYAHLRAVALETGTVTVWATVQVVGVVIVVTNGSTTSPISHRVGRATYPEHSPSMKLCKTLVAVNVCVVKCVVSVASSFVSSRFALGYAGIHPISCNALVEKQRANKRQRWRERQGWQQ